jgi:hypothetical protein
MFSQKEKEACMSPLTAFVMAAALCAAISLFVLFALLSNLASRACHRDGTAAPGTGSGGSLEQFHFRAGGIHVK